MSYRLTPIQQQKQKMRAEMRTRRMERYASNPNAANMLADLFRDKIQLEDDRIIASYNAFRGEIDPAPLAAALRALGHRISLPVVPVKTAPLIFRLHEPGDFLISNKMGITEPDPTATTVDPDILLVPLLAFDASRNRLGYGAGFYDRTIAGLRARKPVLAIGIAYAFQQVAFVPTGSHDIALDRIVTETGIF